MFTVKATYRNETRRFTFPDSVVFPTYTQLHDQLFRLFPISRNYYLSRLIFSPDASKPGRILIGKQVHSAEDYDSCITPLRRLWPNPLLRFTIFDGSSPEKAPTVPSERLSVYSAPSIPLSDVMSRSPSLAPQHDCASLSSQFIPPPPPPLQPLSSCVHPSPPLLPQLSPSPPPPIIFTPRPNGSPRERGTVGTTPCCSITQGKADIQVLLSSFKAELERILRTTFGSESVEQQFVPLIQGPTRGVSGVLPQTGTPVSDRANASRWCFVCRTSFSGVWYGCIKCPWHAVCPSCFSKSHSAHTLSFGPSHVVQQCSTDCLAQVSTQVTEPASSSPAGGSASSVLHGVLCDRCDQTVAGVRHKCLDCPDYDLCAACMKSGAAEQHNPFHEFIDIETPGRVFVHTVLAYDRNRSLEDRQQVSGSDGTQASQQGLVSASADQPVRHLATCNLCDSAIIGDRFKCVACPDFDTCSSCFRITMEQHPSHGFVRVNKPEDLMMRDSVPFRQAAHSAVCDSCRKTIHGARFKCMHPSCPDFDLCSNCEALPIPVHPLNHPLLKLKTCDTAIPTVNTGQTRTIGEPSYQKPVSVCSEPLIHVIAPDQATNVAVEDRTPFSEEFLSPLGSPVSGAPDVPVQLSHLVDAVEPPASPRSIRPRSEMDRQSWPRVNQEMMRLDAVQSLKTEEPVDHSVENTKKPVTREPFVAGAPLLASRVTSFSREGERHWTCPVSPISNTESIFGGCRPSPVSSSVRQLHRTAQQLPTDEELVPMDAHQSRLDSALVANTNVPDGQIFPPGAEFVKGWHMVNNGGLPWPTTTEVQFVSGEMFASECSTALRANVGVVYPGQGLDIWTGDLKAPDTPGRYVGYWRLSDGQGNFFGSSVWIDLTVADHHSDQASEHSLAASSMVMPSTHSTNSISANDELRVLQPSLPSTGTAMGEVEDPESDISSVSLVSVPTSDDDDAEWQDTRTHSEPLEYVVLYDSNSEE